MTDLIKEWRMLDDISFEPYARIESLQDVGDRMADEIERLRNPWQDISTAPKDGRVIDLWSEHGFRYPDARWDWVGDDGMGWTDKNHHGPIDEDGHNWTHWMPLPPPPTQKEGGE